MQKFFVVTLLALGLIGACRNDSAQFAPELDAFAVPEGFPAVDYPEDNYPNAARVALGRALFYDPMLSRDSSLSCATCHPPERAFADALPVSVGFNQQKGFRNVPTLTNVAYHPYFFREGGNPTLEQQMFGPLFESHEMGLDAEELRRRLAASPHYRDMAREAYDRELDIYVLSRAIAAFQRTLISGDSPFDRYRRGDAGAMSLSARRGRALFFSDRLMCTSCHSGADFSDYTLQNIGSHRTYVDQGLFRITNDSSDIGKFKVPTLRNVALTGPYLHDGSLATLAEVVELYNRGGLGHPNQSPLVRRLGLNNREKRDLVAFLEALTDTGFVNNPAFRPEAK